MKIRAKINLKPIAVLVVITLILVFFACQEADPGPGSETRGNGMWKSIIKGD